MTDIEVDSFVCCIDEVYDLMELSAGYAMVQAARQLDLADNDVDVAIRAIKLFLSARQIFLLFGGDDPPVAEPRSPVTLDDLAETYATLEKAHRDYQASDGGRDVPAAVGALERLMEARQKWFAIVPIRAGVVEA